MRLEDQFGTPVHRRPAGAADPTIAPGAWEAEVVGVDEDGVVVKLPGYDGRHDFGPCPYVAPAGEPAVGDRVLAVFSDDREPWVLVAGVPAAAEVSQGEVDELADRLSALEAAPHVVRGTVAADGTLVEGSGFTAQRTAAGQYTLTFDPAFSDVPSLTAMVASTSGPIAIRQNDGFAPTASIFKLTAFSMSGFGATDAAFHFVAAGPR